MTTLLYHALRRDELCRLTTKKSSMCDAVCCTRILSGNGGKTRYVLLHPAANVLESDYLEKAVHVTEDARSPHGDAITTSTVLTGRSDGSRRLASLKSNDPW